MKLFCAVALLAIFTVHAEYTLVGEQCLDANDSPVCHSLAYCNNETNVQGVLSWTCECMPGTMGNGTWCVSSGYAVRFVLDKEPVEVVTEEPEVTRRSGNVQYPAFKDSDVIGQDKYCLGNARGWFMRYADTNLNGSTADGEDFTEVFCLYYTQATAEANLGSYGSLSFPNGGKIISGPLVKRWQLDTTSSPTPILPTGLEVDQVYFEPSCSSTGCWVITGTLTTGETLWENTAFNTFYLPHAVGNDTISYDFDYAAGGNDGKAVEWTFSPANAPCTSANFEASNGNTQEVTTCCISNPAIGMTPTVKGGLLANYRTTVNFSNWADSLSPCSGKVGAQCITRPDCDPLEAGCNCSNADEVEFPSEASSFLAPGKFVGMPVSPGVTELKLADAFLGQYTFIIKLDEVELRRKAGKLVGTVGVEHTVDTFLGLANFRSTGKVALDTFSTQTAIHLEKTNFFSVSTHGTNDYTFLEYVNMRLVTVYDQNTDFSNAGNGKTNNVSTSRTSASGSADYVQVTFTLGSKYNINANSGLIPLTSVRAGKGTFFSDADLVHRCVNYTTPAFYQGLFNTTNDFSSLLRQSCAPQSSMCVSPTSIPDHFVSFNIPLGIDYLPAPSQSLSNNIFVEMVISATTPQVSGADSPNEGGDPMQMKTTLKASIPVVQGGVNIFCDGLISKTDLKDVANVDIVVGSAFNKTELSRLRILKDVASTQLSVARDVQIDSDSIEAGLMTLVLKGNASYFATNAGNSLVSMELEDVITIHIMSSNGNGASSPLVASVTALVTAPPDDNSFTSGLDTDGYNLNGAFKFTVDRTSQRAHLEPLPALTAICPFNPTRPGPNLPLQSCVTRRDVRYRAYPARTGSVSTAMEICANVNSATLQGQNVATCSPTTTSAEAKFFTTIFGNSAYARQLAVDFAGVIFNHYNLNGRYRRAYWINPGYEWTPTQTGGNSIFSVSQKLFMFALITLDEGITTASNGNTVTPKLTLPNRRRMLLSSSSLDEKLKDSQGSTAGTSMSFNTNVATMMANAFGVKEDRVATFSLKMQLTAAEACDNDQSKLQNAIRITMEDYVKGSISAYHTLQITSVSVNKNGVQCRRRNDIRKLLEFSQATADVAMLVVFKAGGVSQINVAKIATMPGIQDLKVLSSSNLIDTELAVDAKNIETPAPSTSSSSTNVALIAGVVGGVGGALLVAVAMFVLMRSRKPQDVAVPVQAVNVADLKAQLSPEV